MSAASRWPRVTLTLYLWSASTFILGSATLLGPVRWLTSALRARGVEQHAEDWLVRAVIALLLLASLPVTTLLARQQRRAIPPLLGALTLGTLALWFNPALLTYNAFTHAHPSTRFVFGPYPERAQLEQLKAEGYSAVISLLHPAVLPFEPGLLAKERQAAREVGLELIHAPMLPWLGDNRASLAKIRALAEQGRGRYYIHCYLGKDRINLVRRHLESTPVSVTSRTPRRPLQSITAFERGPLHHLPGHVHVTPFPTDDEWLFYVLAGTPRHVLSLLDPANPEDAPWIKREQTLSAQHQLPLTQTPVQAYPFEPQQALRAARQARQLPGPLLVHAFRNDSPAAQAFVQAYLSDLPPLPPALLREPLQGGHAQAVAPNIITGPQPTPAEFGAYLWPRGVRGVLLLGAEPSAEQTDHAIARSVGLLFASAPELSAQHIQLLKHGGPWYVYGPQASAAQRDLEQRFDPLIHDALTSEALARAAE